VSTCTTHPEAPAHYQCDGCRKNLCDECVEESHVLLICRLCGERALPLADEAPATVKERKKVHQRTAASAYGLADAFKYPFRGPGGFVFLAALGSAAVASFVFYISRFSFLVVFGFLFWLGWLSLLVGIQFKIVAETARFRDELPDWPSYYSLGERAGELFTFLVIFGLQWGPILAYLVMFGGIGLITAEPSLAFWVGAAACLWLGMALGIMGWGAASIYWRRKALRIDLHLQGLKACGADALVVANITFVLAALFLVLRGTLDVIPILGRAISGALGIYWAFLSAHLVGLMFRRNAARLDSIYGG